jgi:hypothetical protein
MSFTTGPWVKQKQQEDERNVGNNQQPSTPKAQPAANTEPTQVGSETQNSQHVKAVSLDLRA